MFRATVLALIFFISLGNFDAKADKLKPPTLRECSQLLTEIFYRKYPSVANHFNTRVDIDLKQVFDDTLLYPKDLPGIPAGYPIANFAVNWKKNRLLLEPESHLAPRTGSAVVVAEISSAGTAKYLDTLGEGNDFDAELSFNPTFIGKTDIARIEFGKIDGTQGPFKFDMRFFDLSDKKKELPSLSEVFKMKFSIVYPFSDSVYVAKILNGRPGELVVLRYHPVEQRPEIYYQGIPLSSTTQLFHGKNSTLKASVSGKKIFFTDRSLNLVVDSTKGQIEILRQEPSLLPSEYLRVLNNESMNAFFTHTDSGFPDETIVVKWGSDMRLSQHWNVRGILSKEFYETSFGYVTQMDSRPDFGLMLLKNDGSVKPITSRFERFKFLQAIDDVMAGLSRIKRDGSLNLTFIPLGTDAQRQ